jgi:hypothetical protein
MSRKEAFEAYFDGKAIGHKTFKRGQTVKADAQILSNKEFWVQHINIYYHHEIYKEGWFIATN